MVNHSGRPLQVGFYEIIKTLGKGNFAVVKLANIKSPKRRYVVVFVFLYKVFYSALYIYNNLNKYAYSYRLHVIGTTAHLFHVKIKFFYYFHFFLLHLGIFK